MPLRCKRCGLLSPDGSLRCDCGLPFNREPTHAEKRMLERQRSEAHGLRVVGIALIAASVGLAVITLLATHGRSAFLWFGLTIVGVRLLSKASRMR